MLPVLKFSSFFRVVCSCFLRFPNPCRALVERLAPWSQIRQSLSLGLFALRSQTPPVLLEQFAPCSEILWVLSSRVLLVHKFSRLCRTVCSFFCSCGAVCSLFSSLPVSFERIAPVFSDSLVLFERFAPVFSNSLVSFGRFAPVLQNSLVALERFAWCSQIF